MEHVKAIIPPEGGNPVCAEDIEETAEGFLIRPYTEDSDANYKFRLEVDLVSSAEEPVPAQCTIDWQDETHNHHRGYVLLSPDGDTWTRVDGRIEGGKVVVRLSVPPGRSRLCMHPPYDYGRLQSFAQSLPQDLFKVHVAGKSLKGRDILAVEVGNRDLRPIVVMTRVHPYESIGSFFCDGMMRWIRAKGDDARRLVSQCRIVFLPMPNPDGVAEGWCKRTLGGLDYSYAGGSDEPEAVAVRSLLSKRNAISIFDLHGHMNDHDRFRTNDAGRMAALHRELLGQPSLFNKELFAYNEAYPPNGKQENMGGYVVTALGGVFFNSSWTWFGRDAAHLRSMGVSILRAYAGLFGSKRNT